ncbi:hypothetical protein FJZ53_02060 [Candidatus Woesearchaeota archaeon]|nr:hypothetical protein [Candidatus Woesearchaeota archaeon]
MKKKGDIWVSAVLYIALGMVVVTLILTAGLPLINKMRDRNTIAQTKSMMFNIDANIKAVANEAKGSTRYLSPVDINSGQLFIGYAVDKQKPEENDTVRWFMKTNNKMIEPRMDFSEGDLKMRLDTTAVEGEYEMNVYFDYNSRYDIKLTGEYDNPLQGRYSLSIKNKGYAQGCADCLPEIEINVF